MTRKTHEELVLIGADTLACAIYHTCCRAGAMDIPRAEANGMIAKHELRDGAMYAGYCRNAGTAVWNAKLDRFIIERTKFGDRIDEALPHPADDEGFDVFVPVLDLGRRP